MSFERIIYRIVIAGLVFIVYMAVRKIKWQEKRLNLLQCGVKELEKIDEALKKAEEGKP